MLPVWVFSGQLILAINADALRQAEKDFHPVEDLLSLEGNWIEK